MLQLLHNRDEYFVGSIPARFVEPPCPHIAESTSLNGKTAGQMVLKFSLGFAGVKKYIFML